MQYYRDTFLWATVLPKMHMLEEHIYCALVERVGIRYGKWACLLQFIEESACQHCQSSQPAEADDARPSTPHRSSKYSCKTCAQEVKEVK